MKDPYKTAFGRRLKTAMVMNGHNRTSLARDCYVCVQTICDYVNGETLPNAEVLARIALILNLDANWLLGIRGVNER